MFNCDRYVYIFIVFEFYLTGNIFFHDNYENNRICNRTILTLLFHYSILVLLHNNHYDFVFYTSGFLRSETKLEETYRAISFYNIPEYKNH